MDHPTVHSHTACRHNKWLCATIVIYLLLVFLFAAGTALPCLLAWPVSFLALSSLFLLPRSLTAAFLFCALGDFAGQLGSFVFQMLFFALGHIWFILFFARRHAALNKRWFFLLRSILLILIVWAYATIAVHVADVPLRLGVVVYTLLIATMAFEACRFGSPLTAAGGWLFIVSDAVLAYNKFTADIPDAGIVIMSTYYLAQLLLFTGAALRHKTAEAPTAQPPHKPC